jgi:hypothetical protein
MICQHCNSEIHDGAVTCAACGAPVNIDLIPPPQQRQRVFDIPDPNFHEGAPPLNSSAVDPPIVPQKISESAGKPESGQILGMDPQTAGTVSLVVGIISLVLACGSGGCGGVIGIFGAILGYMSLKSNARQLGMWGLVLNGLALLGVLVAAALVIIMLVSGVVLGSWNY